MKAIAKLRDQHAHEVAGRRLALGDRAFCDMVLENCIATGRLHVEYKALQALMEAALRERTSDVYETTLRVPG